MAVNHSLNQPPPSSNSSSLSLLTCLILTNTSNIFAFTATNALLLLPLSALVLLVAVRRRGRGRGRGRPGTSHTDFFTYHMLAMETLSLLGSLCYCIGAVVSNGIVMLSGFNLFSIILPGQAAFHCLTCVERHLAVVHPVTYLGLRRAVGRRLRNLSVGGAWLLCSGWMALTYLYFPQFPITPFYVLFASSLVVTSSCSLSVLRALTRPGRRGRGDRVFLTIVGIMATLLMRFAGVLVCMVMFHVLAAAGGDACLAIRCGFWFCVPSSLVLPLLFLHRADELGCVRLNAEPR